MESGKMLEEKPSEICPQWKNKSKCLCIMLAENTQKIKDKLISEFIESG
jgi:hypothetical protein